MEPESAKDVFSLDFAVDLSDLAESDPARPEPEGRAAAGLVLITHGFNPGINVEPEWTVAMQADIACRLHSHGRLGRMVLSQKNNQLQTSLKWLQPNPENYSDCDIILRLDWTDVANHLVTPYSTINLGAELARFLLSPESGLSHWGQMPIHLIGHSRGASLVCALARELVEHNIDVDQVTTLDPHPLTADDPHLPGQAVLDAPVSRPERVSFMDNYWQKITYPKGRPVEGAYNLCFPKLPGAYHFTIHAAFADHMNLIMAYHASIRFIEPLHNGEATLKPENCRRWFSAAGCAPDQTGYLYSRAIRPDLRPEPNY